MNNEDKKEKMVTVSEKGLLALVAFKVKGVVLFPEKLEDAKQYLKKLKMKSA